MAETESSLANQSIAKIEDVENWLDNARLRLDVAKTKDERARAREQIRRLSLLAARLQMQERDR